MTIELPSRITRATSDHALWLVLWLARKAGPLSERAAELSSDAAAEWATRLEARRGPLKRGRLTQKGERLLCLAIERRVAFEAGLSQGDQLRAELNLEQARALLAAATARDERLGKLEARIEREEGRRLAEEAEQSYDIGVEPSGDLN